MINVEGFSAKVAVLDLEALKSSGYATYKHSVIPLVQDENDPRYVTAIVPAHACTLEVQAATRDERGRLKIVTDGKVNALVDSSSVGGITRSYLNLADPEGHETNKWAQTCTRVEFALQSAIPTSRTRLEDGSYIVKFNKEKLVARMNAANPDQQDNQPVAIRHQLITRQEAPTVPLETMEPFFPSDRPVRTGKLDLALI